MDYGLPVSVSGHYRHRGGEVLVVQAVLRELSEIGYPPTVIRREMQLSPRHRVDIAVLQPHRIILFECKLHANQDAVRQLLAYRRVARAVWPELLIESILVAPEWAKGIRPNRWIGFVRVPI